MDRFVAMVWNPDDPSRQIYVNEWSDQLQRQSSRWRRVLDQPGLRVYSFHHRGDGPVVTGWVTGEGIVIGVLFERGAEGSGRVRDLDRREAGRVIATRGNRLIKKYWGNYVAIWRDAEKRRTTV